MTRQRIIWTALPNGFTSGAQRQSLRMSVFVSPRLQVDGNETPELGQFPDFQDWPARLRRGIAFEVVVDALGSEPPVSVPARVVTRQELDSDLWKAIFDPSTPVKSRTVEGLHEPYSTPPTRTLHATLSEGYGKLAAASPYGAANTAQLQDAFPEVAGAIDQLRHDSEMSFDAKLAAAVTVAGRLARASDGRPVPIIARRGTASAIAEFAAFHSRPIRRTPRSREAPARLRAREVESTDFHQILSVLGEYPELLRRLGLVIDLELAGDFPRSVPGHLRRLSVKPALTPAAPPDESYLPATKYLYDQRATGSLLPFPVFAAAPRAADSRGTNVRIEDLEVVGGLLNLRLPDSADPRATSFDLIQVDVDGAIKKLVNALDAIDRDGERTKPVDATTDAAAPAFRTTGLSLLRSGHAQELLESIGRAADLDAAMQRGETAELFAEDLVRGYRIDVRRFARDARADDPLPPWMSLHQRIGAFRFERDGADALELTGITDEGFVQPAIVQDVIDPESAPRENPLYIHESMFHWQGWSLSTPPPMVPMAMDPATRPPAIPQALKRMAVDFSPAARSLPRLRFGSHYQVRVRTADLAGNGLSPREADAILDALTRHLVLAPVFPLGHKEFPYQRFEPLAAPTLVPSERLTEGQTIDVMVIRSNGPSAPPDAYAATLGGPPYRGIDERHIVPPKTTQLGAETHGSLDGAFGEGADPLRLFNLCRRDGGSLNDGFVTNLASGASEPLADVVRTNPITGETSTIRNGIEFVPVSSDLPTGPRAPESAAGGYTVHYENQLRLPYLPDPLVSGASLFGLPGLVAESLVLDETGALQSSGPDRQLLPQDAIDALGLVTKIHFGPARDWPELRPFRLRLTGTADGADSRPTWIDDERSGRILTVGLPAGTAKTIWVSCYPDAADIPLMGVYRWAKRWFEAHSGPVSSERHFLNTAPHGALTLLSPARRLTLVHAVQQPLLAPTLESSAPFNVDRMKENDTAAFVRGTFRIHAPSTAKVDLLATWTEPVTGPGNATRTIDTHVLEIPIFDPAVPADPRADPAPIATFVTDLGDLRVKFMAPDPSAAGRGASRWLAVHEFGDTRHRNVIYRLVATTRFREYFPAQVVERESSITRMTTISQTIRSSAPPPVPSVTCVVPAFRWDETLDGLHVTESRRSGGALRVYLGDSWHASGNDEQLAVVSPVAWGADPLHLSRVPAAGTQVGPIGATPVSVETDAGPVTIHPFPVFYEEQRKQWYCDITFDAGGFYFPFVALKLARYQEHSLAGLHLSPIVYAGVHQLTSDRWVRLDYSEVAGRQRVAVSVEGRDRAADSPPATNIGGVVEVTLEQRDGDHPDPDLGWTPVAPGDQPVADPGPSAGGVLWRGAATLPDTAAGRDVRLVVCEYEVFEPVESVPGQQWIGDAPSTARRLVYADTIPL